MHECSQALHLFLFVHGQFSLGFLELIDIDKSQNDTGIHSIGNRVWHDAQQIPLTVFSGHLTLHRNMFLGNLADQFIEIVEILYGIGEVEERAPQIGAENVENRLQLGCKSPDFEIFIQKQVRDVSTVE